MTDTHRHICQGTCSKYIDITYDKETKIITDCFIYGGCNGNTKGVSALVKGRTLDEVHNILRGIKCGPRPTSCPNELALGIEEILYKNSL